MNPPPVPPETGNQAEPPSGSESLDDLGLAGLKIYQPRRGLRFSLDAVMLARFVSPFSRGCALDIGTGGGIIPLLLSALQPDLQLAGIELQSQLAALARKNVAFNHLQTRIAIYQGDVRDESGEIYRQRYELLLCNPPFYEVGTGRVNPLPELAVARHELALTLPELLRAASLLLAPAGDFLLIHRAERLAECLQMLPEFHLHPGCLRLVHPRAKAPANRFLLSAGLTRRRLIVSPPLEVYQAAGVYSAEIQRWMEA
jgi:tRNA1(Val) A37 N6-methylase TrmN6